MIITKFVLKARSQDRDYDFTCDTDAPLEGVRSALCEMLTHVTMKIKEMQQQESVEPRQPEGNDHV